MGVGGRGIQGELKLSNNKTLSLKQQNNKKPDLGHGFVTSFVHEGGQTPSLSDSTWLTAEEYFLWTQHRASDYKGRNIFPNKEKTDTEKTHGDVCTWEVPRH